MKLGVFNFNGQDKLGSVVGNHMIDLRSAYALYLWEVEKDCQAVEMSEVLIPDNMVDFLRGGTWVREAAQKGHEYVKEKQPNLTGVKGEYIFYHIEKVKLQPPLKPKTVMCSGPGLEDPEDYTMHKYLEFYLKSSHAVIGHGAPILYQPQIAENFDSRTELGVIIDSPCRHVNKEEVIEHIYGFTIFHNIFSDKLQVGWEGSMFHIRYGEGASFDNSAVIGPWIVDKTEITNPENLIMKRYINGKLMETTNTNDLLRSVYEFVSYCSIFITLEPGVLISCGSPSGLVLGRDGRGQPVIKDLRKTPRYLQPGDTVLCEIEGIGVLENPVEEI